MNIASILYVALWSLAMREEMTLVYNLAANWSHTPGHLIDKIMVDSEWT